MPTLGGTAVTQALWWHRTLTSNHPVDRAPSTLSKTSHFCLVQCVKLCRFFSSEVGSLSKVSFGTCGFDFSVSVSPCFWRKQPLHQIACVFHGGQPLQACVPENLEPLWSLCKTLQVLLLIGLLLVLWTPVHHLCFRSLCSWGRTMLLSTDASTSSWKKNDLLKPFCQHLWRCYVERLGPLVRGILWHLGDLCKLHIGDRGLCVRLDTGACNTRHLACLFLTTTNHPLKFRSSRPSRGSSSNKIAAKTSRAQASDSETPWSFWRPRLPSAPSPSPSPPLLLLPFLLLSTLTQKHTDADTDTDTDTDLKQRVQRGEK